MLTENNQEPCGKHKLGGRSLPQEAFCSGPVAMLFKVWYVVADVANYIAGYENK